MWIDVDTCASKQGLSIENNPLSRFKKLKDGFGDVLYCVDADINIQYKKVYVTPTIAG